MLQKGMNAAYKDKVNNQTLDSFMMDAERIKKVKDPGEKLAEAMDWFVDMQRSVLATLLRIETWVEQIQKSTIIEEKVLQASEDIKKLREQAEALSGELSSGTGLSSSGPSSGPAERPYSEDA